MEQDAIYLIIVNHLFDVFLLEILIPYDEYLSISPRHCHEWVLGIKILKNPAIAICGGNNCRLEINKKFSQVSQLSPDGHAFPVEAELFSLHSAIFTGNLLLQFLEKHLIILYSLRRTS